MNLFVRISVIVAAFASAAAAENLNVSKIVKGSYQSMNFATAELKPFLANAYSLNFNTKALGGISSESNDYYLPAPWAETWQTSKEFPKLQREEPTPADTDDLHYESPYWKLALVDMTTHPREVKTRIFKSGSAEAMATYSVKVEHFGSPGDYFLNLQIPTMTMSFASAYSLCCPGDYNGGTYQYKKPKSLRMRTAVDVYANNLPVWSAERTYTYAEDLANTASDHFDTYWDRTAATGSDVLYLGRFNAGEAVTFSFVVRTNVVSDAPNCGDAHIGAGYPEEKHCSDGTAKVAMAGLQNQIPSLSFYAKTP